MLTMKTLRAFKCMVPGTDAALIKSGVAATIAASMAIKWVSALPGSFIFSSIIIPPIMRDSLS